MRPRRDTSVARRHEGKRGLEEFVENERDSIEEEERGFSRNQRGQENKSSAGDEIRSSDTEVRWVGDVKPNI
jgi:hypothetical protein